MIFKINDEPKLYSLFKGKSIKGFSNTIMKGFREEAFRLPCRFREGLTLHD